jgi:hypothetical protein
MREVCFRVPIRNGIVPAPTMAAAAIFRRMSMTSTPRGRPRPRNRTFARVLAPLRSLPGAGPGSRHDSANPLPPDVDRMSDFPTPVDRYWRQGDVNPMSAYDPKRTFQTACWCPHRATRIAENPLLNPMLGGASALPG